MRALLAFLLAFVAFSAGAQTTTSFDSLTNLLSRDWRSFSGGKATIETRGYYSPGDGGGGNLYLDSADTNTVADNVLVYAATPYGRYKRIHEGVLNAKWAGAVGNGVADDTAAIQAAFDAVQYQGTVFIPPCSVGYLISGTITNAKSANIEGSGFRSALLASASFPTNQNYMVFKPDTMRQGVRVSGLFIYPQSGRPGQHGLFLDVSESGVGYNRMVIENNLIRARNGWGIYVYAPNKNHDAFFTSVIRENHLQGGIKLEGAGDSITIWNNVITTRNDPSESGRTAGVWVDLIKAADPLNLGDSSMLLIEGNNITCGGGAVKIVSGVRTVIRGNNIEGDHLTANNSALIDIDGATNAVIYNAIVEKNFLGPGTHEYDELIRVNHAIGTRIQDNFMTTPRGRIIGGVTNDWRAIYVLSPALETSIRENLWPTYFWSGQSGRMVNNAAFYTRFFQPVGFQALNYQATIPQSHITPDVYDRFEIVVTDGNPFTIEHPNLTTIRQPINVGHQFTILLRNESGGDMGAITWGADYVVDNFVPPPNGKSGYVTFQFQADAKWHEIDWSSVALTDLGDAIVTRETPQEVLPLITRITGQNPDVGAVDLLWSALSGSEPIFADEEFATGVNSVAVYDVVAGGKVTVTRQTSQVSAPNKSKAWLKVSYDGTGTYGSDPNPYFGGFSQIWTSSTNNVYVQRFLAKLPIGLQFVALDNAYGSNATNYWLTPKVGTGKWEMYARVVFAGNTGSFVDGGYIAVAKDGVWSDATPWDCYVASATVLRLQTAGSTGGTTYTAGNGIDITGSTISTKLLPGSNISLTTNGTTKEITIAFSGSVLSSDTNYAKLNTNNVFTGTNTFGTVVADTIEVTSPIALSVLTNDVLSEAEAAAAYQPLDADLTDLADGSLTGSKVGSGIDDDNVSFDDADNLWTATTIGAALEEMNDSINAGSPNGTGAKVHWSQLLGVPAGFADNSDDGAGGSGDVTQSGTNNFGGVNVFTNTVALLSGATPFKAPTRLVIEGDSLSDGYTSGSQEWPYWISNRWLSRLNLHWATDAATANETASNMVSQYATQVQPYAPSGGTNAVLMFWGGINDIASGNVTNALYWITNYWGLAKADGFTLVGFTITDSWNISGGLRPLIAQLNNLIRKHAPTYCDYFVDTGALLPDSEDPNWTPDGVHWNSTAGQLIADHVGWTLATGRAFIPRVTQFRNHPDNAFRTIYFYPTNNPRTMLEGVIGFDTDAWGSAHGALQWWDGSRYVYTLNMATNLPSNGQIPMFTNGYFAAVAMPSGGTWDGSPIASGTITNFTSQSITLNGDTRTSWPSGGTVDYIANPVIWWDCDVGTPASGANWGFPSFAGGAISSGTTAKAAASAGRPGQIILASASGANSGYSFNSDTTGLLLSGGEEFTSSLKFNNTNGMIAMVGFHDASTAADAVDGVYWRLENGFLYGVTANNSSRSATTTSNQVTLNAWYKIHIAVSADPTNITYTLYSETTPILTNSLSSNIPTARTTGVGITAYNVGAGASNIITFDYVKASLGALTR